MRLIVGGSSKFGKYLLDNSIKSRVPTYSTFNNTKIKEGLNNKEKKIYADVFFKCDLSCSDSISRFLDEFQTKVETCRQIVFCASLQSGRKNFGEFSHEDFLESYKVNFLSTVQIIKFLTPMLSTSYKPSIVIILSKVVETGGYRLYPYSSSKGALFVLCKSLSKELAEIGIRLNSVMPGHLVEKLTKGKKISSELPVTTYTELCNTVEFLLSNHAEGIVGQSIILEGRNRTKTQPV